MTDPLPLTGERTLPGIPAENYWFRRHEAAYAFAAVRAGGRVLEVGAGEGYGAAMLGARVVALEYEPAVAAHARRTYGLSVAAADACALPVRPGSVDTVVSLQVLEHLYCADRFVAACRAALRPGGILVLSTPNRPTFSPAGTRNPFHVYEYDAEELAALLRVHFGQVRMAGLGHGWRLRRRERRVIPGGSLPAALMSRGFEGLDARGRALVGAVRAGDFRIEERRVTDALDLVAVCRA